MFASVKVATMEVPCATMLALVSSTTATSDGLRFQTLLVTDAILAALVPEARNDMPTGRAGCRRTHKDFGVRLAADHWVSRGARICYA